MTTTGTAGSSPPAAQATQASAPGHQLVGTVLRRGIATGEIRAVDVQSTVHTLLLPMVMPCTHKHVLGACASHTIDASKPIADHVELVLAGLLQAPDKPARQARPIKSP